jgi:hypothetical protein
MNESFNENELENSSLEDMKDINGYNYRIYLTRFNKKIVLIQKNEKQTWHLFKDLPKDVQFLLNKQNHNFTKN